VPLPAKPPGYPIESVGNALRLLLLFRERTSIRVAEASDELGVVRSTAHRLLAMLQYFEFVRQDAETKDYRAGPALWDIGLAVVRNMDLLAHMPPYLEEVAERTGETSHLVVLQGTEVRFIAGVESSAPLRTGTRVGDTYPAYATSSGKVLLAALPDARIFELYADESLAPLTGRTLTTRAALLRELRAVRRKGFGASFEENEPDICAVSVAVPDVGQPIRCALSVSAPVSRLTRRAAPRIAETLREIAERAAADLR
jgi:IclR family acetate operon transcriptional repressor